MHSNLWETLQQKLFNSSCSSFTVCNTITHSFQQMYLSLLICPSKKINVGTLNPIVTSSCMTLFLDDPSYFFMNVLPSFIKKNRRLLLFGSQQRPHFQIQKSFYNAFEGSSITDKCFVVQSWLCWVGLLMIVHL